MSPSRSVKLKNNIRKYFSTRNYSIDENLKFELVNWKFQFKISKAGESDILLDIYDPNQPIKKYCDLRSLVKLLDSKLKYGIVAPQDTSFIAEDISKLNYSDVEVYTSSGNDIQLISSPSIQKEIKDHKVAELRGYLQNINLICTNKFGFKLFKKDQKHFDTLLQDCKTKNDFVVLVASVGTLIDEIFIKDMKNQMWSGLPSHEKRKFKNGSISIIELILQKNSISYNPQLIKNLRAIKKIRNNLPPIHSGDQAVLKILRSWGINCRSIKSLKWKEVGEIYLEKYISTILLLRDTIKI